MAELLIYHGKTQPVEPPLSKIIDVINNTSPSATSPAFQVPDVADNARHHSQLYWERGDVPAGHCVVVIEKDDQSALASGDLSGSLDAVSDTLGNLEKKIEGLPFQDTTIMEVRDDHATRDGRPRVV